MSDSASRDGPEKAPADRSDQAQDELALLRRLLLSPEQDRIDRLKMRSLASTFPPLAAYLRSGIEVLDVGCGPGNITADVATEVAPGHVIGIDES